MSGDAEASEVDPACCCDRTTARLLICPVHPDVMEAWLEARRDPALMARIAASVEEHRPVLDLLAADDGPHEPTAATRDALAKVIMGGFLAAANTDDVDAEMVAASEAGYARAMWPGWRDARIAADAIIAALPGLVGAHDDCVSVITTHVRERDNARAGLLAQTRLNTEQIERAMKAEADLAALKTAIERMAAKWDAIPLPLAGDLADDLRALMAAEEETT